MNSKGRKTTIVAYASAFIIFALLVAMFMDKITVDDFFKGLTVVGTAAAVFVGRFSKDETASHTHDTKADVGGELPPGGPPPGNPPG